MANEWTKVELFGQNRDGEPIRYTIAAGTAVSQGSLLGLRDPRTVVLAGAGETCFAGVSAEELRNDDTATSVSVWTQGIFEAVASGAMGVGANVTGVKYNKVQVASASLFDLSSGAYIIGKILETSDIDETVNVRLNL